MQDRAEYRIAKAFSDRAKARTGNAGTDGETVYYHHNRIAWRNADGSISFTLADYPTLTTRRYLNAIHQVLFDTRPFYELKGQVHYNEDVIDRKQVITRHILVEAA